MSHLSKIRLELKNKVSLVAALQTFELQHEAVKGIPLEEEDIFIPCEQFGVLAGIFDAYNLLPGIKFEFINDEYEIQTDLWAVSTPGSKLTRDFAQELKRRYAQAEITAQAQAMGFQIGGFTTNKEGNLVATLVHGTSSVQCTINQESAQLAVAGVHGSTCTQLTAQLAAALGTLQEQSLTQEFYLEQNPMLQNQQQIGRF